MSFILILAFLFFCGSLIGWIIELLFRRFYKKDNPNGKWVNPGLLIGPYLPIYGLALCILYVLATLEPFIPIENVVIKRIILFIIMAIAITAIEYIGGVIFIKKMNIKLWDYSREWGNINGIICPLFSAMWAGLSALYYFAIHPFILDALQWLSENLAFSFFIGFFFGIFFIDLASTLQIVSKIREFARDNDIVVKYEEFKLHVINSAEKKFEKVGFFRTLHPKTPLREYLKSYRDIKLYDLSKFKKKRKKK